MLLLRNAGFVVNRLNPAQSAALRADPPEDLRTSGALALHRFRTAARQQFPKFGVSPRAVHESGQPIDAILDWLDSGVRSEVVAIAPAHDLAVRTDADRLEPVSDQRQGGEFGDLRCLPFVVGLGRLGSIVRNPSCDKRR